MKYRRGQKVKALFGCEDDPDVFAEGEIGEVLDIAYWGSDDEFIDLLVKWKTGEWWVEEDHVRTINRVIGVSDFKTEGARL